MESQGSIYGLIAVLGVICVGIAVFMIATMWKIFQKAGKPGWASIVPVYNSIVLLEIVGKPIWWIIMFFIPLVNIVFAVWATNMLSKSFGKSEGYTIGLLFLGIVFFPMLAFGDAKYIGPVGDENFVPGAPAY